MDQRPPNKGKSLKLIEEKVGIALKSIGTGKYFWTDDLQYKHGGEQLFREPHNPENVL